LLPEAQPFAACSGWAVDLGANDDSNGACKADIDAAVEGVEVSLAAGSADTSSADQHVALTAAIRDVLSSTACETSAFETYHAEHDPQQWLAMCSSAISSAMAEMLDKRVALRTKLRRKLPDVDFSELVCIDEEREQQIPASVDTTVTEAFAIDLAFSLDGTARAEVAPNKDATGNEALSAVRSRGAISDGLNSLVIEDVPITAVVRRSDEKTFRYRQIIHVNQSCVHVKGHPCAYPTADANAYTPGGEPTGRVGPCQRPAEHYSRWYDTDPAAEGAPIIKPFKVLVDTYHVGPAESNKPDSISAIRGASVRGVHSLCESGVTGACPQNSERECTGTFPFNALPIVEVVPSAGVTENELTQGTAGRPKPTERDAAFAVPPTQNGFDLLANTAEYLDTAIIKDFQPQEAVGDEYGTAQVLLSGVAINEDRMKGESAGPGGTRFENHRFTEAYFRCPTTLGEIEEL